jgi:hypothetical protein
MHWKPSEGQIERFDPCHKDSVGAYQYPVDYKRRTGRGKFVSDLQRLPVEGPRNMRAQLP